MREGEAKGGKQTRKRRLACSRIAARSRPSATTRLWLCSSSAALAALAALKRSSDARCAAEAACSSRAR